MSGTYVDESPIGQQPLDHIRHCLDRLTVDAPDRPTAEDLDPQLVGDVVDAVRRLVLRGPYFWGNKWEELLDELGAVPVEQRRVLAAVLADRSPWADAEPDVPCGRWP